MIEPEDTGAVLIHVKAVPGARTDKIVGRLGERLKIRVSAPPRGGRANEAIARLLAARLNVRANAVALVRGAASAEKTFRVVGVSVEDATRMLMEEERGAADQ